MDKQRKVQWQPWWWLLLLVAISWPAMAMAHGSGAPRLVNVLAGPYRLWVWSLPDPLRTGEAHISVAVEETAPPNPQHTVDDYAVNVTISALDQSHQQFTLTTSKQERFLQTYYEVDFAMPKIGEWQATVNISGPAGVGTAAFTFTVLPPQRVNWEVVIWSAVMLIAIIWTIQRNRTSAQAQQSTAS